MEEFEKQFLRYSLMNVAVRDLPQAESKDRAMVLFDKATMDVQQEHFSVTNLTLQAKLMLQDPPIANAAGFRPPQPQWLIEGRMSAIAVTSTLCTTSYLCWVA
jgi:hypothetical protein